MALHTSGRVLQLPTKPLSEAFSRNHRHAIWKDSDEGLGYELSLLYGQH